MPRYPRAGGAPANGVRPDWVMLLTAECQRVIGAIEFREHQGGPLTTAQELISRVPDPETPVEERLLRGLLLELAMRWSEKAHQQAHQGDASLCKFRANAFVQDAWRSVGGGLTPSKMLFEQWFRSYFAALNRAHPSDAARAAQHIQAHSRTPLNVHALARAMGVHPVALRRAFKNDFGVSIRGYHLRARVADALRLMSEGSHDARSALFTAGWSSPKNFYRAVLRVTGMSVREVRALSPSALARRVALPDERLLQQ